jgi:two-component system chemotaxis sensor kinase CheA
VSLVYGFSSMLMGGLLVHFGQGPVQIEMHFYFFALLAMLAVFGNPLAILVAAVTVAIHHFALWLWLPKSVFNYAAPFWVVLVHAAFVVLESVATCFIARSFFDNVIGLEKIVQARTAQLDARNRDMRLVLDTVSQGFLTVDRQLAMSSEKSAILERWFGPTQPGQSLPDYLSAQHAGFAQSLQLGWQQVLEDFLPLELTIDQLPRHFVVGPRHFELAYTPILDAQGTLQQALVVISDVSADHQRERVEAEQRDVIELLGRVAKDRVGVLEFLHEARELVTAIADHTLDDETVMKRLIHTLKGNAMIFGVQTVAALCHHIETELEEQGGLPDKELREGLRNTWTQVSSTMDMLLGSQSHRLEIDDAEYASLLRAIERGESGERLAALVQEWKLEPCSRRLMRAAEQAQAMAKRMNKATLRVEIDDHGLRLEPGPWATFWSSFVHVIRNAVDHGIEPAAEREAAGKPAGGQLSFGTSIDREEFVITIRDDGRGIDWSAVAKKAERHGLPHQTQADLVEALFADGFSTRYDVTEYSGRGVGMGVLREACKAQGGKLCVESEPGRGTKVEFRFPRSAMRSETALRKAS